MKKTLAFLLSLAMLFTALSVNVFAAETAPTIEIVTNSISNGKTTFAVKINGNPVKGVDITVNVTNDAKITGVSAKNFDVAALTKNQDYTISEDGKKLHAVGLQKDTATGEIISVTATATNDFTIKVSCDIATSDKIKVTQNPEATVTAYVEPENKTVTVTEGETTVNQPTEEDYFIPNGAVYYEDENGKIDYVAKGDTGNFTVNKNAKYIVFKIPTGGFGTYGVRDSVIDAKAKEFGNYVLNKQADKKYGTIVISGDWEGFKNYYMTNGKSESDLVTLIYKTYFGKKTADRTYVPFKAGESIIKVFNVPQTRVLWENLGNTTFEYGVRMNNIQPNSDYATIAYCATSNDAADDNVVLSQDIKTTHNN